MDVADLIELTEERVLRMARDLAVRHAELSVDPRAVRNAGPEALAARAKALREDAEALSSRAGEPCAMAAELHEVAALQERFVAEHPDWIEERISTGRVRLFPDAGARPDAARGRDVAAPVASLSVELAAGGRTDVAERLLADYAREANDYPLYRVADFYERDAAARRALRPDTSPERAHRLLALSRATARRPLLPPAVVALGGMVASGKSTVATAIASRLAAPRIEGDRVREFMEGAAPGTHASAAQRLVGFAPGFEERTFEAFLSYADAVLDSGRAVVLDCGLPTRERRRAVRELAARHAVPFRFVECRADPAACAARLAERNVSDACVGAAWEAVAAAYAESWEPPDEIPDGDRLIVDTTRPLEQTIADVADTLPLWPAGIDA